MRIMRREERKTSDRVNPDHVRNLEPHDPLRIGAITFCRNEADFLPKWVDYYGKQFGVDNLYVVDDNSDDGSTDNLPCDVIRIPPIRHGSFNSVRMSFVGNLGKALHELYDVLLFCDTDEFVVPDPARFESLATYIAGRPDDVLAVGAVGLNVVHAIEAEAPLDLELPLLGQRRLAKFLPLMCKPSIKWVPARWSSGTHGVRAPYVVDPDLWMFHFKFGDRDLLRKAADHRAHVATTEGRSPNTNWRHGGDEMVTLLEEITAGVTDLKSVPAFKPPQGERLERLVVEDPQGNWRAPKGNQTELMRKRPLVRIPSRFHGLV